MNTRPRPTGEVPIGDFYALRWGRMLRAFGQEHFCFWMITVYLFFEYIRPQAIIPAIDFLPWASIFLLLALIGRITESGVKWVADPANGWITGFLVVILLSCFNAYFPDWAWKYFPEMLSWYVVYFLVVNTVTNEKRLLLFLAVFLMASFKLSAFGARTWISRGFAFEDWGIQGPPGFFMNSGELTVQMLMFAPIAYHLAMFLKPHITRLKFWILMMMPVTASLTIAGASSRGSQVALVYQFYRSMLKGRINFKTILLVSAIAWAGWTLLPVEQKARFSSAGTDGTSQQRLIYWERGLEMVQDHPLLGVGFFNFPPYFEAHYPQDIHSGATQVPHNIFVQVGTDAGLLGLFFFGMLIYRSFRISREVQKFKLDDKPYAAIAKGLQIALWGFIIAGQFVTVTYYPFFWMNLAMTVCLGSIARREFAARASAAANKPAAPAGALPTGKLAAAHSR